jgi:hypothetical protein
MLYKWELGAHYFRYRQLDGWKKVFEEWTSGILDCGRRGKTEPFLG